MSIERKDSVAQGNCFKVYMNGEQFAIVRTEMRALAMIRAMAGMYGDNNTDPYYYGLAYVSDVGF